MWGSAFVGAVAGSPLLLAACGDDSGDAAPTTTAGPTTTASPATTTEAPPEVADVRFQFDWIKNVQFAGHYVAEDQGYFAAEGVNAGFAQGGGGIATEVTVNGPGIEMGASSFLSRTIDAMAAGADLVVLGAALQQSPIGFIYLPDNPINTIEDLVGKRIGLQGESGIARRQHPCSVSTVSSPTTRTCRSVSTPAR
ncbi:MAG: ABC transporter substrate-binding protein [Acidimicrobiaceae bacterium]|nr:ABC transporter substrate-binding protein [Acidimicrobiaceae bacterium]